MDNFDYPAIGQRIKQLRKRKGLNQTELAQMLKKSLRTVQKYETGEIEVSIAVVNQIADLLDTTSTYILGYESSTTQIRRSEEHTSELQSHYSISYAVFCLKYWAGHFPATVR